ncbi:MAG: DUF1501 domain-containing protein [Opitutus sp.]|nr:DUF1501 domain-containing protein [Opitutus sp.]
MNRHPPDLREAFVTRRDFLTQCGMGMGALSLAAILGETGLLVPSAHATASINPLAPRRPHFPGKAKRVVHFFLNGGPSHVDSFDPKPALLKYAGQRLPGEYIKTERKTGAAFPSPFQFRRYGRSGLEISDLFPRLGALADDLCLVRSMKAEVPNHEPSLMLMNCGSSVQSRPSLGSWTTYGLGTENLNLPGFIVMCPRGFPTKGADNWQSGFLPGVYQGTPVDSQHTRIEQLIENIRNNRSSLPEQRRQLDLIQQLNADHERARQSDGRLEARIQSFELAYRMQLEATDAFDVSKEPASVRESYGSGIHGRQTLIARRLLERGVRFVQLWHGASQPWDSHEKIEEGHRKLAQEIDQPAAAFIRDLKQRGMLEDTLIIFGGEFGRTPTVELGDKGDAKYGRDHNPYGFTVMLAGGGVKGGLAYGATDEFGFKAVDKVVEVHDLHATILHLLGFDHERLTYRYAGRDFRLTDVYGHVVKDIIT